MAVSAALVFVSEASVLDSSLVVVDFDFVLFFVTSVWFFDSAKQGSLINFC